MTQPAPVVTFDTLPLVMTVEDILAVYRIGYSTLRKQLANSTFEPRPFARDPYRWLKRDVQRHLERMSPGVMVKSRRGRKKTAAA
jgi:hypothetical protein